MADGHSPRKPPGQGDFGPVYTSKPRTSSNSAPEEKPRKTSFMKGIHVKGVGGSKKS